MKSIIKQFDSFGLLKEEDIDIISEYSELRDVDSEKTIVSQHEESNNFYIVVTGKITKTLELPGSMNRLSGEYNPGDFFGEIPAFSRKPSYNTFVAAENSSLLVFSQDAFDKLIADKPTTASHFIRIILSKTIQRLRESSSFLADVVQWGESASRRVITDEMTGIYNRAFLDDAMDNFFHISKSNKKAVSLLMIDVDNFRKANDKLGLDIGDSIIIEISTLMQGVIEKDGIIARYGGDEFSILLPEATIEKAVLIAESIRKNVEESTFSQELRELGIPITISVGVSSYPQCGENIESFKEKADKNLYKAKEDGRNRVVC